MSDLGEMLETLARVAFDRAMKNGYDARYDGSRMTWEGETEALREDWRRTTRATLLALDGIGYRVVPVEPTDLMISHGSKARDFPPRQSRITARAVWANMVRAAPKVGL